MKRESYTAAVGNLRVNGTLCPHHTCGHKHKTYAAAWRCGERLCWPGLDIKGQWRANPIWRGRYVIDSIGQIVSGAR